MGENVIREQRDRRVTVCAAIPATCSAGELPCALRRGTAAARRINNAQHSRHGQVRSSPRPTTFIRIARPQSRAAGERVSISWRHFWPLAVGSASAGAGVTAGHPSTIGHCSVPGCARSQRPSLNRELDRHNPSTALFRHGGDETDHRGRRSSQRPLRPAMGIHLLPPRPSSGDARSLGLHRRRAARLHDRLQRAWAAARGPAARYGRMIAYAGFSAIPYQ